MRRSRPFQYKTLAKPDYSNNQKSGRVLFEKSKKKSKKGQKIKNLCSAIFFRKSYLLWSKITFLKINTSFFTALKFLLKCEKTQKRLKIVRIKQNISIKFNKTWLCRTGIFLPSELQNMSWLSKCNISQCYSGEKFLKKIKLFKIRLGKKIN